MIKNDLRSLIVHTYFLLTIMGLIFYFSSDDIQLIFLLGCHATVYPIFGMILAVDSGLRWLRIVFAVFWAVYAVAFVACYLIAWFRRRYFPLAMIALMDAVFSLVIVCWAIVSVGFEHENIPMLIGILFSFLTFVGMLYAHTLPISTSENA